MTPLLTALLRSHIEAETGAEHILIVSADEHHAVIATVEDEVQRQYRVIVKGNVLAHSEVDATVCAECGQEPGAGAKWDDCVACTALVEAMRREPTSGQMSDWEERMGGRW
jgi:hypothetical protein